MEIEFDILSFRREDAVFDSADEADTMTYVCLSAAKVDCCVERIFALKTDHHGWFNDVILSSFFTKLLAQGCAQR